MLGRTDWLKGGVEWFSICDHSHGTFTNRAVTLVTSMTAPRRVVMSFPISFLNPLNVAEHHHQLQQV